MFIFNYIIRLLFRRCSWTTLNWKFNFKLFCIFFFFWFIYNFLHLDCWFLLLFFLLKTRSLDDTVQEFSLAYPSWYIYRAIIPYSTNMEILCAIFGLSVFYISGEFLIKQLFHSRLLDVRSLHFILLLGVNRTVQF